MQRKSLYIRLLTGAMALLGFSSCDHEGTFPDLYGPPIDVDTVFRALYGVMTDFRDTVTTDREAPAENTADRNDKNEE